MDTLVLVAVVLGLWGSAVVVCHHDRRSIVRFLPLLALAVGIIGAVFGSAETVAIGAAASAGLLIWTSINTSPSLIPVVPFLPILSVGVGVGLNWIASWLGTTTVVAGHAFVLFRAWRSYARDTERRLALVRSADAGALKDLACPSCGQATVSVRFTHPADTEWRTWFVCSSCKFEMRAQNSGKPTHFSEDLIDPALEARDRR